VSHRCSSNGSFGPHDSGADHLYRRVCVGLPLRRRRAPSAAGKNRDGYVEACGAIVYYETIGQGRPAHGPARRSWHPRTDIFSAPIYCRLPSIIAWSSWTNAASGRLRAAGQFQKVTRWIAWPAMRTPCARALGLKKPSMSWAIPSAGSWRKPIAIKYPSNVRRLILAGTGSSASRASNADFKLVKDSLDPALRARKSTHWNSRASSAQMVLSCRNIASWRMRPRAPYEYVSRPPAVGRPWRLHWVGTCSTKCGGAAAISTSTAIWRASIFVPALRNLQIADFDHSGRS